MDAETRFWRSYAGPVLVTICVFSGLNFLWIDRTLALHDIVPLALAVYLTSSAMALAVLWWAIRAGRLSPRNAGLELSGWTPPKRLLGLAMVLVFGYGGFTSIEPASKPSSAALSGTIAPAEQQPPMPQGNDVPPEPAWGDYCFWFVFLLSASLTELLVFVALGFCLTEAYLRRRGIQPLVATGLAALFGSVTFGLYHFTYPEPWSNYAIYPLMPVMMVSIGLFVITRNFYLVLLLHNAFAAVGFTTEQYSKIPFEPIPAMLQEPNELIPNIAAFVVPFLFLHLLEAAASSAETGESKIEN
jgi:hypothetical protein